MNATIAKPTLLISFIITSVLGIAFLFTVWMSRDLSNAWLRSGLFVAVMGIVHVIGYRLYLQQDRTPTLFKAFDVSIIRPHLTAILATQLPCLLLSSLLLDGGRGFRVCVIACLAHWLSIGLVTIRAHSDLASFDRFIVRWGFFPFLAVAVVMVNVVW